MNTADDFQCCDIQNQFCEDKDVVIDDVTCKETSEFVCTKEQPTEEYGPKVTVCRPVPKKNCYRTPRTVSVRKMLNMIILICLLPRSKHFCQKLTNTFPRPVAKQNCHFEPKKNGVRFETTATLHLPNVDALFRFKVE